MEAGLPVTAGRQVDGLPPTVSVVVAAYNASATVRDCLNSLCELDYPRDRVELIVVDNDSSDDTCRIVEEFGQRVTLCHEERRGAAAARNRGIEQAGGEIIAFTDSDCVVDRAWLAELLAQPMNPDVGVVGGRIRALRPCSKLAELSEDVHDHERAIRSKPPYAITMNWASPKKVLEEVGSFDPLLLRCQDVDLAYRIVQAGYRLVYVDDAIVYHRNRGTLSALLREAHLHGRGKLAINRIHADYLAGFPPSPSYPRRVLDRVRALRDRRNIRTALFRLLFDLGKISGEVRGELK